MAEPVDTGEPSAGRPASVSSRAIRRRSFPAQSWRRGRFSTFANPSGIVY